MKKTLNLEKRANKGGLVQARTTKIMRADHIPDGIEYAWNAAYDLVIFVSKPHWRNSAGASHRKVLPAW